MKKFNNFSSAFKWSKEITEQASKKALPIVTEQSYKDSEQYTYKDTNTMYKSGQIYSDFDKGIVKLRTPYVKVRYYVGGMAGSGNRQAVPMWFEKTKKENKHKYIKQYVEVFNREKRGGL